MVAIDDIIELFEDRIAGKTVTDINIKFNKCKDEVVLNSINFDDGTCIVLWSNDSGDVCFDLQKPDN